jgi:hypothetical protein
MKVDTYACDGCQAQKGTLNHWFKFTAHEDQFSVHDWSGSDYPNTLHLCSDACVIKAVQGWLSAQKELSQKGEDNVG